MKFLGKPLLYLTVLLCAALLVSCGDDDGDDPDNNNDNNNNGGTVRIGVLLPATGAPEAATSAQNAVELAQEEINNAGGINGMQLEFVYGDTELDPTTGKAEAERLINEGCIGIIGSYGSSVSISVSEATIPANIPQICWASTSAQITDLDDNNLVWRTALSDEVTAQLLAIYAFNDLNLGTVSLLYRDNAYGSGIASQFETTFTAAGGTIDTSVAYDELNDYSNYDFATKVNAVYSQSSEGVYVIGYTADGQLIIQEISNWKTNNDPNDEYNPQLLCGDTWQGNSILKNTEFSVIDGMIGTASSPAPDNTTFFENYRNRYNGQDPEPYAVNAYDAVYLFASAIEAADTTSYDAIIGQLQDVSRGGTAYGPGEWEQIRSALEAGNDQSNIDYNGASGNIEYDENGDVTEGIVQIWRATDNEAGFEVVENRATDQ